MRYTFKPDDCMVITIPIGSIRNAGEGQLMPDKFTCRFKDTYKVFQRGRPKALGAAQIIVAVFIMCLGGLLVSWDGRCHPSFVRACFIYIIPCILYILCGVLSISAGHTPLMPIMKASFVFNIIGLFSAVIITTIGLIFSSTVHWAYFQSDKMCVGLSVVISVLYAFEFLLSVILIYWESKGLCRAHFNSLPMITLKQDT
ncbi:membrane-spanning 4-domains subfamily A member 4D [Ictalurus punctatus]|uniref:Membrane-spanning 4-domains subfamily A member 4D n=1 Tax=Ictalurus punctatus TaxID=7998 RepID=A0A2D0PR74_ICTPU|nr:membrane-spanning 4-domains subfamily A member 4D [Ictalurus punctatus]XP_017308507.1 membrane-spanning 4-domains subfamily A member 4D [Ictalurus punctatus]